MCSARHDGQVVARSLDLTANRTSAANRGLRSGVIKGAELYQGNLVDKLDTGWHLHDGWQIVAVTPRDVTRTQMLRKEWPVLLRALRREQHPDANEQTALDLTVKKGLAKVVPLFLEGKTAP